jgi:hypothetical protein
MTEVNLRQSCGPPRSRRFGNLGGFPSRLWRLSCFLVRGLVRPRKIDARMIRIAISVGESESIEDFDRVV